MLSTRLWFQRTDTAAGPVKRLFNLSLNRPHLTGLLSIVQLLAESSHTEKTSITKVMAQRFFYVLSVM